MNGWGVPSTRCAAEIAVFDHPDRLPDDAVALFAPIDSGGTGDVYATRDWYRTIVATALPEGATPAFVLVREAGRALLLFPLQQSGSGWQSLTTPYTCLYRPLLADWVDSDAIFRAGRALARFCLAAKGLRFEALDPMWPGLASLLSGLRAGGLVALRFAHFGNWHAPIAGLDWDTYLASRSGALRQTIRRKSAKAARDKGSRLELFCGIEELERGIAAFEAVYGRSWKEPEPHPNFNAMFMRMAASHGLLRLGVMWQNAQPIAVQYWVVTGATASVLKLAHDEAARALSPGTVLTAWMIERLIAECSVKELDFGRGDDPYKQGWANQRRQRIGFVLVDPRRTAGIIMIARHWLGRLRHKFRQAIG
jgi:CelD/BcsL family acetyltransferase involved in cellulose biosynthesis